MKKRYTVIYTCIVLLAAAGCNNREEPTVAPPMNQSVNVEQEEQAILKALNDETSAAFQRDYEAWKENWVHDPDITKTYINFEDSTFSESVGWNDISQFVKTFMEEHPEPEPVPTLLDKIDVRRYGNGAWVTYEQQDSLRGLKRETRLMEKVNGQWKIAGMHTTIYGFGSDEGN